MAQMEKKGWIFALMLCAGSAGATEEAYWAPGYKLAGEIIMVPAGKTGPETATENREKARTYRSDGTATPGTTVVIVPEDEEGILSPRGGSGSLPSNRAKAREYRNNDTDVRSRPQILVLPNRDATKVETSHDQLEINRSKAHSYMKGETPVGMVGTDGFLVVNCVDTGSASGRIGDNTQGGIITIYQKGKPVKARCRNLPPK